MSAYFLRGYPAELMLARNYDKGCEQYAVAILRVVKNAGCAHVMDVLTSAHGQL